MSPYNKLWTKTSFARVPEIGGQEGKGDKAVAYVKIFCITNDMRWYVLEYDPKTGQGFCLVTNHGEAELGYSAIHEVNPGDWGGEDMQSINNQRTNYFGVPPFERDAHFKPTTIAQIKEKLIQKLHV